jgi:transposase
MSVAAENLSREELLEAYYQQQKKIADLEHLTAWLNRQLFGRKSERLEQSPSAGRQLTLGEGYEPEETPPPPTEPVKSYERRRRKNEVEFGDESSRLKFEKSVPQKVVNVPNLLAQGMSEDEYEVIGEEVAYRLSQAPGPYVVLKYVRPTIKVKATGEIATAPVTSASSVIERSIAEASFIVGLLLDKFMYHLPLYRQHQRLEASGIYMNRMTLTNLVHRAAQMLEPVYVSLQSSILLSHVLALDETPIKAGRKVRGKMHQGYLWGMYGDKDELAFLYSPTRSGKLIEEHLEKFVGTLITDGYSVYERFAAQREDVLHAQCWVHTRRKFFEAKDAEPELAQKALMFIGLLYDIKEQAHASRQQELLENCVSDFFSFLRECFQKQALLPTSLFTKAASYALERERALRVFLKDDKVPLDTNHLERQIRPVAIGRKNWLFHWTEVGAEYAAIIQSLIASCKLQDVDPYTYFVDVLQRIESHPMSDVHLLTPRLWKQNFADSPYLSDLDGAL